jgi:TetR/AcrR family transcriptional regulator, transcriptional repressor for nem operon
LLVTTPREMRGNSKETIIRLAADLFNRKGLSGTSLSDICEATGLTKGAIYANFKDKNELAVEVFRYNTQRLTDTLTDILKLKDSPHEKLLLVIDFHAHAFQYEEFRYGCPIANMAPEVDDTHTALKEEVLKAIATDVSFYESLIREAITRKEYPTHAQPAFASTLFACLEGALLLAKATQDDTYLQGVCTLMRHTLNSWRISTS